MTHDAAAAGDRLDVFGQLEREGKNRSQGKRPSGAQQHARRRDVVGLTNALDPRRVDDQLAADHESHQGPVVEPERVRDRPQRAGQRSGDQRPAPQLDRESFDLGEVHPAGEDHRRQRGRGGRSPVQALEQLADVDPGKRTLRDDEIEGVRGGELEGGEVVDLHRLGVGPSQQRLDPGRGLGVGHRQQHAANRRGRFPTVPATIFRVNVLKRRQLGSPFSQAEQGVTRPAARAYSASSPRIRHETRSGRAGPARPGATAPGGLCSAGGKR